MLKHHFAFQMTCYVFTVCLCNETLLWHLLNSSWDQLYIGVQFSSPSHPSHFFFSCPDVQGLVEHYIPSPWFWLEWIIASPPTEFFKIGLGKLTVFFGKAVPFAHTYLWWTVMRMQIQEGNKQINSSGTLEKQRNHWVDVNPITSVIMPI